MKLHIIVLAKQVPDTRNVGQQAMNADGTINRSALPAIFNPEDLNALEQALQIKEANPGSSITVLTMGPYRAADILREALYRGADEGVLLTDRAFAGADTLATSYAIASAIRKIGSYDIVLCGRQAIDGDTAQVGPQVAQQLGLPQITYSRRIAALQDGKITVERSIENGVELVEAPLPLLLTVDGSAAACRPCNAYRMLRFHRAAIPTEQATADYRYKQSLSSDEALSLKEWSLADINGDATRCGLAGSPTKVRKVENIIFQAKESKRFSADDDDIKSLVDELLANHTIG
ncbi:MAG: electron transfer flavoprotein subunit beta/FixA family protein [Bacteroidaceae bacterium]|nr:electron transfer flavoprotein subunit beta/FixA family protein [Bacteroidaceae bacterium]